MAKTPDITVMPQPDRSVLGHAFLFELPGSVLGGTIQITGHAGNSIADRTTISTEVSFVDVAPMRLQLYNVSHPVGIPGIGGDILISARALDTNGLFSWLRRAYPISRLDGEVRSMRYSGGASLKCSIVNSSLIRERDRDRLSKRNLPASTRYYGMVTDAGATFGAELTFMRGCANFPIDSRTSNVGSGPTGIPQRWPDYTWDDKDGTYGDWYGGHELGHTYNRRHASGATSGLCADRAGVVGAENTACRSSSECRPEQLCIGSGFGGSSVKLPLAQPFPNAGGSISPATSNPRRLVYGFDSSSNAIYRPTVWNDVMTYLKNEWVSDFTTHGLMDRMRFETSQAASASLQGGGAGGIVETMDRLHVVGSIDAGTGEVSLQPLFIIPDTGELDPRVPGDYDIVLRDAGEAELARYAFTVVESSEEPLPDSTDPTRTFLFFSELVPYVDGTARVEIDGPTGVLASVTAGMTAPVVELLSPNGGEDLAADGVFVDWDASDADGDPLMFDVEYSADGGETWSLVAQGITEVGVDIDPANLVGSTAALFRVWASDGIHTGVDESDGTLTVENQMPSAEIMEPAAGSVIAEGTTLGFEVNAMDDSGILNGDQIQWRSSRDGPIGTALSLAVSTLSVGDHTITMMADDGDGGVVEESVDVTVVADPSELPVPDDALTVGPEVVYFTADSEQSMISIDNADIRTSIEWSATSSEPWVALEFVNGTTPQQIQVVLDSQGLAPGEYQASLTFTSTDVPGQSVVIDVVAAVGGAGSICVGDCDEGGTVSISELVRAVNIALGNAELDGCSAVDRNSDGSVAINELIGAVNSALGGCG